MAAGRHPGRRARRTRWTTTWPGWPTTTPAAARVRRGGGASGRPSAVDPAAVQTNIVVLDTGAVPAAAVARQAAEQGVVVSALGPRMLRAVTHLDVSVADGKEAGAVVGDLLAASA